LPSANLQKSALQSLGLHPAIFLKIGEKGDIKEVFGKGQARPGRAAGLGSPAVAHPEERKPRDVSETLAGKAFESSRAPESLKASIAPS